mmetsp:Transcript_29011/g.97837  ORF Transcript_29011/g.97837 Transcript_29011/m.97837 type:complete len:88 (+) Transcript_29011:1040-1303(+)
MHCEYSACATGLPREPCCIERGERIKHDKCSSHAPVPPAALSGRTQARPGSPRPRGAAAGSSRPLDIDFRGETTLPHIPMYIIYRNS